jgi:hypothetical protein
MAEPMSLAEFDALADDAARNAAVATTLGWRYVRQTYVTLVHAGGHEHVSLWTRENEDALWEAPAYYTGGDADPFANWALLAELWRALERGAPHNMYMDHNPREEGEWFLHRVAHNDAEMEDDTPHRAACRALVAAGLVPREETADV